MKNLLLILVLFTHTLSMASVNSYHAMNVFKGEYKFTDDMTGNEVTFKVDKKGVVTMNDNDTYYESDSAVNSLGTDLGEGLSIMTVLLAGGSDEQTTTLHIRLYPNQNDGTVAGLLDIVYFENDGPNNVTIASPEPKTKLFKRSKSNSFVG